MYRKQEYEPHH